MHGLIFVTWEKYLAERFGTSLLSQYRFAIGESVASSPLASRVYDDALLLAGVGAASELTHLPSDTLLREYGRYFILNGLTSHLCAYLLEQVHSGRELLLAMRDAHTQLRRTPDALTPPLFAYEAISFNPNELALLYDSPRKLCAVLWGAIEGAAERYGEQVSLVERSCMHRGAAACRFEMRFTRPQAQQPQDEAPELVARRQAQRHLAERVLTMLPTFDGVTLAQLQVRLQVRPSVLLEALHHLQHAGLIGSTARSGDDLSHRRYWRVPTSDNEQSEHYAGNSRLSFTENGIESPRLSSGG